MEENKNTTVNEEAQKTQAGTEPETKKPTFEEMLSDKEYQSEFDKRMAKALEKAKTKMTDEFEKQLVEKIDEANKLAKMTADEKAKFEREKQEADYKSRLAEVTKRELRAEAKEQLATEGLPSELAEVLNYESAESCKASIDAVKTAFAAAVEKAVNSKLRGDSVKTAEAKDNAKMTDEEFYKNYFNSKK